MQNFKNYVTDLYIIEYAESQDIDINELTEEELNELIGKAIGGAFKIGAKSVVGAARLAKKGANRMSASGRADAAEKKADALEKKQKDSANNNLLSIFSTNLLFNIVLIIFNFI